MMTKMFYGNQTPLTVMISEMRVTHTFFSAFKKWDDALLRLVHTDSWTRVFEENAVPIFPA